MFESKLIKQIKERQQEMSADALQHPAKDFAEYRERIGRYQGLEEVLDMINSLLSDSDDPK